REARSERPARIGVGIEATSREKCKTNRGVERRRTLSSQCWLIAQSGCSARNIQIALFAGFAQPLLCRNPGEPGALAPGDCPPGANAPGSPTEFEGFDRAPFARAHLVERNEFRSTRCVLTSSAGSWSGRRRCGRRPFRSARPCG